MTVTTARPATFTYREIALQDRLREVAREVGAKPALVLGDRTVTYRELDERTDRLAAALARRRGTPGDPVTELATSSLSATGTSYGARYGSAGVPTSNGRPQGHGGRLYGARE